MYGKIAAVICTGLSILFAIWFVCRSGSHGRAGDGTGRNTDPVRDNIDSAERRNNELKDAERATTERLEEQAETIGRAERDNQDAQELVQKAKRILHSAKHTNSNS